MLTLVSRKFNKPATYNFTDLSVRVQSASSSAPEKLYSAEGLIMSKNGVMPLSSTGTFAAYVRSNVVSITVFVTATGFVVASESQADVQSPQPLTLAQVGPSIVITETGTTRTVTSVDANCYLRFTNVAAKTVTVNGSTNEYEVTIANRGTADLTLSPANGVTINAPAVGSLVLANNMVATLKRVSATVYDLIGQTK